MKKYSLLIYIIVFFVYQELIFHLFAFTSPTVGYINIMIFSILFGCCFYLATNLFKRKINHIITYVGLFFFTILFGAQFIYHEFYHSLISIYSMFHGTGQVLQFLSSILEVMKSNWYVLLFQIAPIAIFILLDLNHLFSFHKSSLKKKAFLLLSVIFIHSGMLLSIYFLDDGTIYSNKRLYFDTHAPLLTAKNLGVLTLMRLDVSRSVFGFNEKEYEVEFGAVEKSDEEVINAEEVYENQVLEIDFDSLIQNEADEEIKKMHEYFKNQTPSKKNEYTGMFKDKNLIVFVAEALSDIAIDPVLTPNLYKLYEEGFQFTNFYTPLFPVSTADGEYITDTSLLPKEGVWSLARLDGNYMPYSYANVFENLGYTSQSYHNNTATYYKRNSYLATMGYDSFKACGAGLDINCKIWPQSDLEMMEKSVDDYIKDDKFLAYYMTVSGHLEYTRIGNMMVSRNWNQVKDLSYSNKAKSYLACNIELDKAIGYLLKRLEEEGRLEDTVIAISGDHYPYGLTLDEVNELSDYVRDENFEIHHMPFLLWNSEMESVKVEKVASSLDVLPTILNLFGVEFDSRLLMGRDILSDADGLVIFSNRSFITEKGKYNALTGVMDTNEQVSEEYINQMNAIIYNKFKYSRLVLEKDYYRKVFHK